MLLHMRRATAEDAHLPTFDYTKLAAINTCPLWGIVRYGHHKVLSPHGAEGTQVIAGPLQAGKVLHECFAAIRLWQLMFVQGKHDIALARMHAIFGSERSKAILAGVDDNSNALRTCALNTLASSNYIEDPRDTRRSYNALETALLLYCSRWDTGRYPIYTDDEGFVGVEVPFDIVISLDDTEFRFTGRLDGLHWDRDRLIVGENKTASRLNDAWRQSFLVSHQITGYCLAASLYTSTPVREALVWGLQLPIPVKNITDGFTVEFVTRGDDSFAAWARWAKHTIDVYNRYYDTPHIAPQYTHSCNRYFRPCSFIPLCYTDAEERKHIIEHEMHLDEWSPLAEDVADA